MTDANQRSSQRTPFLSRGRLLSAAALYLLLALVPPRPFERPLLLYRLMTAAAPDRVAIPVEHVAAGAIRDSWGNARPGGRRHEGIDIFAPRGTRVTAATEGIVSRVGVDPLGGQVVWILGPAGQMHYYAHLDRYGPIAAGDRVAVGDTIGTVGTTGNARGGPPHLHFGVYARGGAIDPYPLLAPQRPPKGPRGDQAGIVPWRSANAHSGRRRCSASRAIGSWS